MIAALKRKKCGAPTEETRGKMSAAPKGRKRVPCQRKIIELGDSTNFLW